MIAGDLFARWLDLHVAAIDAATAPRYRAANRGRRSSNPRWHAGNEDGSMHGEYKTPGGKLVAVDLEVMDDKLVNVVVHGDFFLYPEEALETITGALEGLPVDLTESEYAEKVRFALPRDAELLGSSPDAIGAAIRRALASDAADAGEAPA